MLREILGEKPFHHFLQDNYLKAPFSLPDIAKSLESFDWDAFYALVPLIPSYDLLVVRNGKLFPDTVPRTSNDAKELRQKGFSIVLRHTERFSSHLARVAHDIERELHGEAVIQLYSTP